jgi:hypothetical protein
MRTFLPFFYVGIPFLLNYLSLISFLLISIDNATLSHLLTKNSLFFSSRSDTFIQIFFCLMFFLLFFLSLFLLFLIILTSFNSINQFFYFLNLYLIRIDSITFLTFHLFDIYHGIFNHSAEGFIFVEIIGICLRSTAVLVLSLFNFVDWFSNQIFLRCVLVLKRSISI